MMGIRLRFSESDVGEFLLHFDVSSDTHKFDVQTYVGADRIADIKARLAEFAKVRAGVLDMRFGEFGPEYAGGAAQVRIHMASIGQLYLTIQVESAFFKFGKQYVCDSGIFHMSTDLSSLDAFVRDITAVLTGGGEANLAAQRQDAESLY